MPVNYDILLLAISTITTSASLFIAFSLLDRIYRSIEKITGLMFAGLSIAIISTGIWANHFILLSANTNIGAPTQSSWALLSTWLFAAGIAACIVYLTILRKPKIYHILLGGLIAGLCDLGMFFTSHITVKGIQAVTLKPFMISVATVYTITIFSFILLQFQWVKTYLGSQRTLIRVAVATGITLSILTVHFLFESAFSVSSSSTISFAQSINSTNWKITATLVSLGVICLLLIAFIFVLIYEKNGKKIFNFILFNTKSNLAETEQYILLDSLTNLPNRRALNSHLKSAKKRCTRSGKSFALAYIDLDHFKPVNDNYGHHVGDAVLSITAKRLNSAVRGCDFVARIGGDEFVAIIEEINSDEDVRPIVGRIVDSIRESYFINHLNIAISCSVGIALYPKDGDLDKLMVCADAAMYKAKDQGKNQYKFYDSEMESANGMLLNLQSELREAIENNQFSIAYLPKIDCKTLTAVGAEALIRWNHPTKGEILPNDFLPAAEHFGLIQEINDWVIDECCCMLVHAKETGLDLNVSINLSSHQFRNPNLVKNITQTIKDKELDPSHISFEIKEIAAINNQKQFKLLLDMFKEAGIKVILDDFGLLPMSLTYLLDLNIDEVKIDKSFIAMVNKDQGARALVNAIFKLTHALGFQATAEGIEDEAQQEAIIDLGCDYMQGHLFSKPVKETELFQLYQKLQFKQLQINFDSPTQKVKKS